MRQRGHLILRRKHDASGANRLHEPELLHFGKTLPQLKLSVSIDSRVRNRFVKRYFRRPLRDGVITLAAFIQADVHGLDFVHCVRRAFHKQVGQAGRRSGIDQRHAVFFLEFLHVAKLLGLEGVTHQVGAEIQVMRAQPQRGSHDNFVKHRS